MPNELKTKLVLLNNTNRLTLSNKLRDLNFYIVIPAHNEQDSIGLTLDSLVRQTLLPKKVVIVNDNSTDETQEIVESYTTKYPWIKLVNIKSSNEHLPGSKIIKAFYKGFETSTCIVL